MTRRSKVIVGVGLVLVGLFLVWNAFASLPGDDSGYELTGPFTIEVSSRAVVTDDVELLRGDYSCYSDLTPFYWFSSTPDEVGVRGVATESETLFMGIAPADAAAGYLDGVVHDEITIEWDCFGFATEIEDEDVVYTRSEGTTDPAAPGTEGFWVASVSGSGEQTLDWTIQPGEWALVIMNADGSPGVSADVQFGVATPSGLVPLGLASLVAGFLAAIGGSILLISSLPPSLSSQPYETPRWTLGGHSVLPTTLEGRIAVLLAVLGPAMFVAPILLFLAVRKGDRGLLLVVPLVASIIVVLVSLVVVLSILVG